MYNASFCRRYIDITSRCFPDYTVEILEKKSEVVKTKMLALTFINKCLICTQYQYRGCHILLLNFASVEAIPEKT